MRLVLASTSPQRRAILKQLRIPFEVCAPVYEEHDPPDADPVQLVRAHAEGKARSVHVDGAVTLGVDTTVHLEGRVYGKPAGRDAAARSMPERFTDLLRKPRGNAVDAQALGRGSSADERTNA